MVLKTVLVVSAAYLAALGVGFMLLPQEIGIGAVPADAPPELIAYLRIFGGPFLGIALLNWLTRNEPPAAARPVILGNIVGFGCVAAMDIWGVAGGAARPEMKVFLVVHLLMVAAFVAAWRATGDLPRGRTA